MGTEGLAPSGTLLVAAVVLDAVAGDPQYSFHPVRLIASALGALEKLLRHIGLSGYGGGCLLTFLLSLLCVAIPSSLLLLLYAWQTAAGIAVHILLLYSLLALRDLIDHAWRIQSAARCEDLIRARSAVAWIVGRDTQGLDLSGCRRAAIESIAENFVDGFLSPLFWYVLFGIPGILLFKVVSTMDSMVGYKTPEYFCFGWCGARFDDLLNYIPARLAWILLGFGALFFPRLSAVKGWRIGLQQHATIPGPNPGWSEATMAGLLQRRLIGPIYKEGVLMTADWIGDPRDPEAGKDIDLTYALGVVIMAALVALLLAGWKLGMKQG